MARRLLNKAELVQVHGEFQLKLVFIMPWVSNKGGGMSAFRLIAERWRR
jgi:hypothetical protein